MRVSQVVKTISAGIVAATALTIGGAAIPAVAAPVVTQVRITMSDGVTSPVPGARLTYTVTLTNRGMSAMAAQIRMAVPPGLSDIVVSAGSLVGREVIWNAPAVAGGTVSARFTGTVVGTSTRLATTACAYVDPNGRPIACASDLDRVAIPAHRSHAVAIAAGGLGALVLIAGVVYAIRRRRRPQVADDVTVPSTRPAEPAQATEKTSTKV